MKVKDADKLVIDFPPDPDYYAAVFGVGGAAGRIVDRLAGRGMSKMRMCVFGMNSQEIDDVSFAEKNLIGNDGLGSGKDYLTAMEASRELLPVVNEILSVPVMAVYVVCLGGATGESCAKTFLMETQSSAVKARMLIATLPHHLEGEDKRERAKRMLEELKHYADGVMVIDYENIDATSISSLYKRADDMLVDMTRAFVRLSTVTSILCFDLNDTRTLMRMAKDKIIDFVTLTGNIDYLKERLKHFDKLLPARYASIADISDMIFEECFANLDEFERFKNIGEFLPDALTCSFGEEIVESEKVDMVAFSISLDKEMKSDDIRINMFIACKH